MAELYGYCKSWLPALFDRMGIIALVLLIMSCGNIFAHDAGSCGGAAAAATASHDEQVQQRRGLQAQDNNMTLLEVLRDFKQSITHDPLHVLDSWDFAAITNYTNGSSSSDVLPCKYNWTGLQCNAEGELVGLSLTNNTLGGSITPSLRFLPPSVTSLDLSLNNLSFDTSSSGGGGGGFPSIFPPSLSSLNLSHNSLYGPLSLHDTDILNSTACNYTGSSSSTCSRNSLLSSLQYLSLDNNGFHGPLSLPPACLPRLRTLSLSRNSLTGPLPSSLSFCSQLEYLDVSFNVLSGTLGALPTWSNLSSLTYLDVSNNTALHGSIPSSLGNCSNLQYLDLSYTSLSGSIPVSLPLGCRNLTSLQISYTYTMSGPLPREFGLLPKLSVLWLESNNFSGRILDVVLNCSQLTILDIFGNRFEGSFVEDFGSRLPKLVKLVVMMNSFNGPIPASLSNCSGLTNLELGFNSMSGHVPGVILGQCVQLFRLDLQHSNFTGSIPPQIGNLTKMPFLILNNNKFTGSLPEELGLLDSLEGVTFEHNRFSGRIPTQIFNCSRLLHLLLHHNHLEGPIPSSISRTPKLELLYADNNMLTGSLPDGLSNCTNMQNFTLSNNLLTGVIPDFLVAISSFLIFDLSYNQFYGSLPIGFGRMKGLGTLDLSNNKLSGSISSDLADCVVLSTLNLAGNALEGSIPSSIGTSLQSLVVLNLSHNAITGSIPSELGRLGYLQELDLSSNNLTGEIPSTLATMHSLLLLNLSYNNLQGSIPEGEAFSNASSLLGNPRLCGSILNKTCPISHIGNDGAKLKVGLAVGATVAFILIVLAIIIHWRKYIWNASFMSLSEPSDKLLRLKPKDIQQATDDFNGRNMIGEGASSVVYKGVMPNGQVLAFKKFTLETSATHSFFREVHSLRSVRHRNLIKVLGYCSNHIDAPILILEYMENGNLDDLLHNNIDGRACNLTWEARRHIVLDIAQGLLYLHNDCPGSPIIHCDIKPKNILFDSHMVAHISDFGLAKAFAEDWFSSTQNVQGTFGYMAPECVINGGVTPKCDVYSLGILVLEMMSGKRPTDNFFQEGTTIVTWVKAQIDVGHIVDILDDMLCVEYATHVLQMQGLITLAMQCVDEKPRDRPNIQQFLARMHCEEENPRKRDLAELL